MKKTVLLTALLLSLNSFSQDSFIFQGFNKYFYFYGEPVSDNVCNYNPNGLWSMFVPAKNGKEDGFSRVNFVNVPYDCKNNWKGYEKGPSKHGGSLRISIKDSKDASGGIKKDDKNERSRCEVIFFPRIQTSNDSYRPIKNGDTTYMSWDYFIPNDTLFEDNYMKKTHHTIMQIIPRFQNYSFDEKGNKVWTDANEREDVNAQPPLLLSYLHSDTNSNARDLHLYYGYRIADQKDRSSSILIKNAVKKGEWNNFKLKVYWQKDDSGFIEMWVNDKKVVNTSGRVEKNDNPNLRNDNKTVIYGQNITMDANKSVNPPTFKFGHYRNKMDNSATLYMDDFIFSTDASDIFKPFNPIVGDIKAKKDEVIKVKKYEDAEMYQFEVIKKDKKHRVPQASHKLDLSKLNLRKGCTYKIRVRVKLVGEEEYREFSDTYKLIIAK